MDEQTAKNPTSQTWTLTYRGGSTALLIEVSTDPPLGLLVVDDVARVLELPVTTVMQFAVQMGATVSQPRVHQQGQAVHAVRAALDRMSEQTEG